ncbi:hypothetical protein [Curtobacterium sp. MCPF17_031]|uniref:hypothetical protein n=1 Tax=Curtobacterium sp. MCPF17_031 TaxID=2175653 RepID=UPI000DA735B1|nr:hypothetical protein [Curtobacterium sp. MCPF17_031]PZE35742.1 hypothetical protein DEJ31_11350 [Curtobacterium sp. MCPF17_031]
MELIIDLARSAWLIPRMQAFGTVGGTAGAGFEAYARVLHPLNAFRDDLSATDEHGEPLVLESSVWRWSDVAARVGRAVHPDVAWSEVSGRDDEIELVLDDGWRVEVPEEGWFDPTQLGALTEHLTAATTTPLDVLAAFWDGWADLNGGSTLAVGWQGGTPDASEQTELQACAARMATRHRVEQEALRASLAGPRLQLPHREYIVLGMTLPELAGPSWMDDPRVGTRFGVGHTPQLLWPEDHTWVVATEIDTDSTIVAGPRPLIASVLADARFEAFEVKPDSALV